MSKKTKDLDYLAMSAMLRAREANMLGRDRMDRMLAAGSYAEAAKLLAEWSPVWIWSVAWPWASSRGSSGRTCNTNMEAPILAAHCYVRLEWGLL